LPSSRLPPASRRRTGLAGAVQASREARAWNTGPGVLSETPVKMAAAFLANPSDVDKVAPFQPWAKALFLYRQETLAKSDPHSRCQGPAGPRQFTTPYGLEIVDQPELKRLLILSAGGSHSWRTIYGWPLHPIKET
jgi:hypothetical protein